MGRYSGKKCRLVSMFGLTASFFVVEIVVGHVTNSMALIADSFHMLSDIAALVIAFISVRMAPKSWDKNTYGWARAEVLGKEPLFSLCFIGNGTYGSKQRSEKRIFVRGLSNVSNMSFLHRAIFVKID